MADSRINVYHNLATMLNAGMPISRALKTVERHGRFGRTIRRLGEEVVKGQSLSDAVDTFKRKFAKLDAALIKVGEHTGQLSDIFELLSQWYAFCQRIKRAILLGLVIPLAELHMAAFIVPVVPFAFSQFDGGVYWRYFFGILSLIYVPAFIILAIVKLTPKEGIFRRILDTFLAYIPFVGGTIRELELGRYCKVFSVMYKAGVPIVQCSEQALNSVVNLVMKDRLKNAHENVKQGNEMSKGFGYGLPLQFKAMWEVGEESGDLDDTCKRMGDMHAENAENRFMILSRVLIFVVTIIIICILIYFVFMGYSQIYGGLMTL